MLQEFTVTQAKSQALAEGIQFQLVNAHVAAVNEHGFIAASDETISDFIFVETVFKPFCQLHNVVNLVGTKRMNGSIPIIEKVSDFKIISYPKDSRFPDIKMSFPGYDPDKIKFTSVDFCEISGRLEKSGEHLFVRLYDIPTKKCDCKRVFNVDAPLFQEIETIETQYTSTDDFIGHFVKIRGFCNGVTQIGNRECVNIVARTVSDLEMYDTPSGLMRTSDYPMFVKDAVVAATAYSPGHTSQIVLWDPKRGGQVQLKYDPEDSNVDVLVNCKVGDKFDVLYCFVEPELVDGDAWDMRHLQYLNYYEGYTPGNIAAAHTDYGPFTNTSEFRQHFNSAIYFSVIGTVGPDSSCLVLPDGYRIFDYNPVESSVLKADKERTVIASGYFLYHTPSRSYCIFDKVEPFDLAGTMTIQDILSSENGTAVNTGPVTVTSITADGFTVWEGGSEGKGIYVDLSNAPAGQLNSYKLKVGDRVIVSGIRKQLSDPTNRKFIFFRGACIGGDTVTVSKKGTDGAFFRSWKNELITWPKDFDNACGIRFSGKLVKSDGFYQIEYNSTPSQFIRFYKPDGYVKETLEKLLGMYVSFDGCYLGYTGSMTLASPRYWYWTLYSVYPDFSSIYSIADYNSGAPLRFERVKVNGQSGVPVTIFNKSAYGVFALPANKSTVSLYAVSNKKVTFHLGGAIQELPASDTQKGLVVDSSNRYDMKWTQKDKDFNVLFSWESKEEDQEDIDVYIFGIR